MGLLLIGTAACSGHDGTMLGCGAAGMPAVGGASTGPSNTDELFDMSHLVEVEIQMAASDWELLRQEGRELISVFDRTQVGYEYTYFDASVTVDGVRYERAGLRKKGYWGSLSVVRPSFKVDLDRYVPGQAHLGLKKLTLNNERGDPSRTHECMAYALFAKAGVPAPRCNLARVVLNGQELGTYAHVESVDKQMLRRHFADDDGNLYEGQLSDFTRSEMGRIELKTNEKKNDRTGLLALVDALEADDAVLLERLNAVLDVDRFRDYWAMELLTGHWDGYTNNANNYMAYQDPASGRFHFLPWGTDNSFERANPRGRIYASGRIASRLYGLPEQRALFRARLAELTDGVWDTAALLAHIEQVAALASDARADLLDQERKHVATWAERLRTTFDDPDPRPRRRASSPCLGTISAIRGSFATSFKDLSASAPVPGGFTAEFTLDGEVADVIAWSGDAGADASAASAIPTVRYRGTLADDREISLDFYIEPSTLSPGSRRFHGGETYGLVHVRKAGVELYVGAIGSGELNLIEAEPTLGAPLRGSFDAHIYQFECAWR